jgi:hypothetical protein
MPRLCAILQHDPDSLSHPWQTFWANPNIRAPASISLLLRLLITGPNAIAPQTPTPSRSDGAHSTNCFAAARFPRSLAIVDSAVAASSTEIGGTPRPGYRRRWSAIHPALSRNRSPFLDMVASWEIAISAEKLTVRPTDVKSKILNSSAASLCIFVRCDRTTSYASLEARRQPALRCVPEGSALPYDPRPDRQPRSTLPGRPGSPSLPACGSEAT